jgi:LysR family cys regulon transcriptional activator
VLNAIDTDVIKAYVELGLGVAIVAKPAFDARRDRNLRAIDASHLFESNTVYLGFRRNNYLRRYALDFIEMLVPQLNRKVVQSAIDAAIARAVA